MRGSDSSNKRSPPELPAEVGGDPSHRTELDSMLGSSPSSKAFGDTPNRPASSAPSLAEPTTGPANTSATESALAQSAAGKSDATELHLAIEQLDRDFPRHFELDREIARGGLGRIVKARDRKLDRVVALKQVYKPSSQAHARFAREVRITARLQHPNIVPVYEAGHAESGTDYYSMRLVDGDTLSHLIQRSVNLQGRLLLLPCILDVANAVSYAHSQGVIHRDLKPANVLVGRFGETVVIDWGLAKEIGEEDGAVPAVEKTATEPGYQTLAGAVLGTPAYMSPEQAAGSDVDARADVYSLGAMLYHLISGRPPYTHETEQVPAKRVLKGPPLPLLELVPDAPRDLSAIVEKAMARDPEQRYQSADAFASELSRFTSGGLVGSYRYSLLERFQRFAERNRASVATAFFALVALFGFGVYSLIRITDERNQAARSAASEGAARRALERRVAQLVVEKARFLLDLDPTLSLAWLKQLKGNAPGAASVAARAQDRGVAFRILRGHRDQIQAVVLAPSGDFVVSSGDDGSVIKWDVESGKSQVLHQHRDRVTHIAFSENAELFAASSYDGTVSVFRDDGARVEVLRGSGAPFTHVSLNHAKRRIAAISKAGEISTWTWAGAQLSSFGAPVDRHAIVDFSPDGTHLVSFSHAGKARLWTLTEQGRTDVRVLSVPNRDIEVARFGLENERGTVLLLAGESGGIYTLDLEQDKLAARADLASRLRRIAISPDGRKVAAGMMGGRVILLNLESGEKNELTAHSERVEVMRFSGDGRLIATAGWDKNVIVHNLETSAAQILRGHGDVVTSLAFSRDGETLATGSWDKTIRLWRVQTRAVRVLQGHRVGVHAVDFAPNARVLASGGHDNTVRLWNLEDDRVSVLRGHSDHIYRVLFSPDGKYLASSSDDQNVRLWDIEGPSSKILVGHTADVEELAFSPDGRLLASAAEDKTARLWSVPDGKLTKVLPHDSDVSAVAFAGSGKQLISGSRKGTLFIWQISDLHEPRVIARHQGRIGAIGIHRQSNAFAAASYDGNVSVWTLEGKQVAQIPIPGASILKFSPQGDRIAVAGVAPTLFLCELQAPRAPAGPELSAQSCRSLEGHRGKIWDLAFDHKGELLISASGDGTARIWNVESLEYRQLDGHRAPIFDLALSPDGQQLATASADTTIRLWPIQPPPAPGRLFELIERMTHVSIDGSVDAIDAVGAGNADKD